MNAFTDRLSLLRTNTVNTYRIQTSYFFENWASLASTTLYVMTSILFIKILYSNVTTFAGYTESQMLFLTMIAQTIFYLEWFWSVNNIQAMMESVRNGELDLILSKPIPALFFITFRELSFVNRFKDGVPNVLLIAVMVDWSTITSTPFLILCGIAIFFLGHIAWHCFRFITALSIFFIGNTSQIFHFGTTLGANNNIPLEGFPTKLRILFSSVIPSLIGAQMTASVILGRSDPIKYLLIAFVVASIFLLLKQLGWIIALRNYSSATS